VVTNPQQCAHQVGFEWADKEPPALVLTVLKLNLLQINNLSKWESEFTKGLQDYVNLSQPQTSIDVPPPERKTYCVVDGKLQDLSEFKPEIRNDKK
jgi:hypothetical protein